MSLPKTCGPLVIAALLASGSPARSAAQRPDTLPSTPWTGRVYGEIERARAECNGGDMGECTHLGSIYEFGFLSDGHTVPTNFRMAAELYRRACAGGSNPGCVGLAGAYLRGVGVRADRRRAVEILEQTCVRDDRACARLRGWCNDGNSAACDRLQASCTSGNRYACHEMRNVSPAVRPQQARTDSLDR